MSNSVMSRAQLTEDGGIEVGVPKANEVVPAETVQIVSHGTFPNPILRQLPSAQGNDPGGHRRAQAGHACCGQEVQGGRL